MIYIFIVLLGVVFFIFGYVGLCYGLGYLTCKFIEYQHRNEANKETEYLGSKCAQTVFSAGNLALLVLIFCCALLEMLLKI